MENMGVTKECESLGVSVLGLNGAVCFGVVSLTDRFVGPKLEPDFTKKKYISANNRTILFSQMQLTNRSALSLRPRDPCSTLSLPGVRMYGL